VVDGTYDAGIAGTGDATKACFASRCVVWDSADWCSQDNRYNRCMGGKHARVRIALLAAIAGAMLASPPAAVGKGMKLIAEVGQDGAPTISLRTETGEPVTNIPGADVYLIEIHDYSPLHNFHLVGPGVDKATDVEFVGTVIWAVSLRWKERYWYLSDPDSFQMRGTFTTDGGPPLTATVGPGPTISLRTDLGQPVTQITAGSYWIVVRDRSRRCNFHLRGLLVDRRTSVPFRGETTWILTLRPGKYRFFCDTHPARMRGSFRVFPGSPG
jgi:hypothetical protein